MGLTPAIAARNQDIIAAMPIARRFVDVAKLTDTYPASAIGAVMTAPEIPGLVTAAGDSATLAAAMRETHPWIPVGIATDAIAATVLRVGLPGGWAPSFHDPYGWGAAGMLAAYAICNLDPGTAPRDHLTRRLHRVPFHDGVAVASARILAGRMAAGDTGPAVLQAVTDCPWAFHPSLLRAHGHLDRFWSGHPFLMLYRSQDAEGLAILTDTMPHDLRRACANGHACVQWFAERHGLNAGRLDRGLGVRDPIDGVIYARSARVEHKDHGGRRIPWPTPFVDAHDDLGHLVVIPADLPSGALSAWAVPDPG